MPCDEMRWDNHTAYFVRVKQHVRFAHNCTTALGQVNSTNSILGRSGYIRGRPVCSSMTRICVEDTTKYRFVDDRSTSESPCCCMAMAIISRLVATCMQIGRWSAKSFKILCLHTCLEPKLAFRRSKHFQPVEQGNSLFSWSPAATLRENHPLGGLATSTSCCICQVRRFDRLPGDPWSAKQANAQPPPLPSHCSLSHS